MIRWLALVAALALQQAGAPPVQVVLETELGRVTIEIDAAHPPGTADGVDSARSDFFICIGDQPSLDFGGPRNADGQGFAVFGRVVAGMDVVGRIQAAPVDDTTQNLTPPIGILKATVR